MKKELFLSLCEGRHEIPQAVDGSIFPAEIQNVADTAVLESRAFSGIWRAAYCRYKSGESGYLYNPDGADLYELALCPGLRINLYVTGLTVALVAALNACRAERLTVTLWHFNRDTGEYYPQEVR